MSLQRYLTALILVFNVIKHSNQLTTTTTSSQPTDNSSEISEHLWNKILLTIVASFSGFGSVAIIITYFLWRDLQNTSRKILVYISLGDFFTVYPNLVISWTGEYKKNGFSCQLQSFTTSVAVMWSFFWTSSLAIYLYTAIVKKLYENAERLMIVFHLINWTVPVILLAIAWYSGYLGYAESKSTVGWCWVIFTEKQRDDDIKWMLFGGKLWEIISYFINAILYYLITRNIKKEVSSRFHLLSTHSVQIAEQGGRKLALVPIIFIVLRIWGTIRFFLLVSSANPPQIVDEILASLQVIGDNSQGIANFILFCLLTERFKRNTFICCGKNSGYSSIPKPKQSSHAKYGGTFIDATI